MPEFAHNFIQCLSICRCFLSYYQYFFLFSAHPFFFSFAFFYSFFLSLYLWPVFNVLIKTFLSISWELEAVMLLDHIPTWQQSAKDESWVSPLNNPFTLQLATVLQLPFIFPWTSLYEIALFIWHWHTGGGLSFQLSLNNCGAILTLIIFAIGYISEPICILAQM